MSSSSSSSIINGGNITVLADRQVTYFPYDCKWVPSSNRFISVGGFSRGTGIMQVYATAEGATTTRLLSEAEKSSPIKCATFAGSFADARHVATGDFEGSLSIWDPEDLSVPLYAVRDAHRGSIINAISGCSEAPGAPEIATGGHDGRACVWDPRLSTGPVAEVVSRSPDCWCVALGPYGTDRALCAGFSDGRILVYDLRCSAKPLFERQTGAGVYGLTIGCCGDNNGGNGNGNGKIERMYTADAVGGVSVYDCVNKFSVVGAKYEVESARKKKAAAWFAKPLPGNQSVFAAGMGSGALTLWKADLNDEEERRSGVDENAKKGSVKLVAEKNLSVKKKAFPVIALDFSATVCSPSSAVAVAAVLDSTIKLIKVDSN